jgi:hypothetical protein
MDDFGPEGLDFISSADKPKVIRQYEKVLQIAHPHISEISGVSENVANCGLQFAYPTRSLRICDL